MALPGARAPVGLERHPQTLWVVASVVATALLCAGIQVLAVAPFLWPAGDGARLSGDPPPDTPLPARPPLLSSTATAVTVEGVAPGSPSDRAGFKPGDRVLALKRPGGEIVDVSTMPTIDGGAKLDVWRSRYWLGVRGPVEWRIAGSAGELRPMVGRLAAWNSNAARGWTGLHLSDVLRTIVFCGAALVLLLLRSRDLTAWLAVLALAFSGVSGGGPLRGEEASIPGFAPVLTVFTWMAAPLAFPIIALAILHFPSRSLAVIRYPWLQLVPFAAAAPMILPSLGTALYVSGMDAARGIALWDATHPGVFFVSAAVALAINIIAIIEGTYRYRRNHDANERRRIRMALYTAVPGVLAYALNDGAAIAAEIGGSTRPTYPWPVLVVLQALVLLPAFGLVYAVGVARVLGPRTVIRRSLQYALAKRTLTLIALAPALALVLSLLRDRELTIRQVVTGSSGVYLLLIAASVAAFRYRERAQQWLDQRFFREEYDARKILLSLAGRVRFETDPADLASTVVNQIDEALHPESIAILVAGVEEGVMTPVSIRHGSAESLPIDGGLATMLRWSDQPLEIFLQDPRSPVHRIPTQEQQWLECTGSVLLVPVLGQDRTLIAVIALGARRSEEAYTAEDRELLASIAGQMALGFDVARLRRTRLADDVSETTRLVSDPSQALNECPRCGRCEPATVMICPNDGAAMKLVPSVPRVVDNKYRLEQLLGRGGMGAVYQARDMRLDRLVAVKVVRAELLGDREARRRFHREAQIVARLQHPSVVAIFDYGNLPSGGAFLVMELIRGEDLRHLLLREGRLEPLRAARILSNVCSAIEAAHREGVLHRDLKPENILLPAGDGPAKVLDFGVAKLITEERPGAEADAATVVTAAGMIVGTPAYMAPEQFRGTSPDTRTDVFSLGVIAYEMLSGELPFGRGSVADVVLAQSRGVPPLHEGGFSPAVERAIRTALDVDADRRPASPQAFSYLLNAAVGQ